MNTNIINVTPDAIATEIAAARQARDEAIERLSKAREEAVRKVAQILRTYPGKVVLQSQLVKDLGLTKDDASLLVYEYGAHSTKVQVARHFTETDEEGNVIPGGRTRVDRFECTGYYMSK